MVSNLYSIPTLSKVRQIREIATERVDLAKALIRAVDKPNKTNKRAKTAETPAADANASSTEAKAS